jgi:hypothetical protein
MGKLLDLPINIILAGRNRKGQTLAYSVPPSLKKKKVE